MHCQQDARAYVERLRRELSGRDILIQQYLQGTDYTVGLVGNHESGFRALPPLEVECSELDPDLPAILTFESKAVADSPFWTQIAYREADLAPKIHDKLVNHSRFSSQHLPAL